MIGAIINRVLLRLALLLVVVGVTQVAEAKPIVIGSKKFTESYVLGEIAKKMLADDGLSVEHRQGMGGTSIVWQALRSGVTTTYPEYSGTISEEILHVKGKMTPDEMRKALARYNVGMTGELGFNNTYAVAMRSDRAKQLGIRTISDLKNHPELQIGVTPEFLNRQDGWRALDKRYGLGLKNVRGMDHTLSYTALAQGSIDLMDAYSTDAKIATNHLVVLQDDLSFFPQYKAVFLYRLDAPPEAITALRKLEGSLDETRMIALNAEAERTKNYTLAAALYFGDAARKQAGENVESLWAQLWRWTLRHLMLVGTSLALAVIVGVPLGIRASRPGLTGQIILGTVGLIQTIPSLALLALLVPVPFLGIGPQTAIVALFLYSLLPIVRNTATGLQNIPTPLRESAAALGLEPFAQLTRVYLPMASRTILAGIKTSAIINIGAATIAALIGAGGYGEPILSGLDLNDHTTILKGAVPAAVLALLVQGLFSFIDRMLISPGLRLSDRT